MGGGNDWGLGEWGGGQGIETTVLEQLKEKRKKSHKKRDEESKTRFYICQSIAKGREKRSKYM